SDESIPITITTTTTNIRVIFAAIPKDYPIPGEMTVYDTAQTIDLDAVPLNGRFIIKTLVLSVDPYMRRRMRDPEIKSITGIGIGVIVRSEHPDVAVGKHVYGSELPHQEYTAFPSAEGLLVLEKDPKLPWTVYIGAAGMADKTAMVIQLAKRDGLRVIASADSEEKVKYMKEIGADVAYWDNVGGDILDAALEHSALYARFVVCYNIGHTGIKNMHQTFSRSLSINGFLIKHREDVSNGLETVGDAILRVQQGKNTGKAVVVVAEE
ncbi:chaperonin 10-like protein, partial [Mycena rosella]